MTSDSSRAFIDIHSHFLPFIDDGAENYDQCLAAANCYLSAGFEKIIATPHYIPGTKWTPTYEQILAHIKNTERVLEQHDIQLEILPGMEIMVTDLHSIQFDPNHFLTLGDKGCYLIEFPLNTPHSAPIENLLKHLLSFEGNQFVIAHPERCRIFHDSTSSLQQLVDKGMMTQINIDSVLGLAGRKVQVKAAELLRSGLVHFLATDTHPKEHRLPPDKDTIQKLIHLLGEKNALQALKINPESLLDCKKVDPLNFNGNIHNLQEKIGWHQGYYSKLKSIITRN